jgi:hypothetical protein
VHAAVWPDGARAAVPTVSFGNLLLFKVSSMLHVLNPVLSWLPGL